MFEKETVFILGAGASWHYNYPTGEDLVKRVVNLTNTLIEAYEREQPTSLSNNIEEIDTIYCEANRLGKLNKPSQKEIIIFLKNFVDRILHVDPPVIDYFLEWNKDLQGIGKLVIALVILQHEKEFEKRKGNVNREKLIKESPYINDGNDNSLDLNAFKDNWYRFILYKILSDCRNVSDLKDNKVKFITFNYDVSLESYLFKGLKKIQFLKASDKDIICFLENSFIHMYGKIRDDPFVDPVPAIKELLSKHNVKENKPVIEQAYTASLNIKTIGDDKDVADSISKAQKYIKDGEDIYILGYGFDEKNSDRLDLKKLLYKSSFTALSKELGKHVDKRIYFTNFGNSNSVNKRASKIFTGDIENFLPDKSPVYQKLSSGPGGSYKVRYEKSIKDVYEALEKDFGFI